jgi:hypothetical protein
MKKVRFLGFQTYLKIYYNIYIYITLNMNEFIIEQSTPTIIYSSYTPAQARAIKKYRLSNKEKINALQRKYYNELKTDQEYLKKKQELSKEYYIKKKALNSLIN